MNAFTVPQVSVPTYRAWPVALGIVLGLLVSLVYVFAR